MNRWQRVKNAIWPPPVLKAAGDFIPANTDWSGHLPSTRFPYSRAVGKGLDSNVIMSPVLWIARNFTEAEAVVQRRVDNQWRDTQDHELAVLLDAPNDFYDGDQLWKATLISFLLDGNAYWLKVRNAFGGVVQLWYLPHFLVEPKWEPGGPFISHYEYRPMGEELKIPVRDIVHIRLGLDPRNTRKGFAPLRPLLREIFTDDEAANFSASILRNMGVPGGMIAPKDASSVPSQDDVERMKEYMKTGFTGDRRGDWLVLGTPTEIAQFGFDPNRLMLTNLRDIVEERVCALLGVPAAVVGFGAGLQQTKVGATMKELRRLAWVSCIIPHQNSISRQVTRQLMPDFQAQVRRFRVWFDTSGVSAFVEEELERARRVALLVEKGMLRVDRAQELLDLEVDDTQDVYLRPMNVSAIHSGEEPLMPEPPSPNGGPPVSQIEEAVGETVTRANRLLQHLDTHKGVAGGGVVTLPRVSLKVRKKQAGPRRALVSSFTPAMLAAATRLVKSEAASVRRMLGQGTFLKRLEEYYFGPFIDLAARTMSPELTSYVEAVMDAAAKEAGVDMPAALAAGFAADYQDGFVKRYAASSRGQLGILAEAEEPTKAILTRLDEWEERRPGKVASRELQQVNDGAAKELWKDSGFQTFRWATFGKSCPICRALRGRTVGTTGSFLEAGESFEPEGAEAPFVPSSNIGHPPAHGGCDCSIVLA